MNLCIRKTNPWLLCFNETAGKLAEIRKGVKYFNARRNVLSQQFNLVPRSLVDEAEGEIWPNPICITWSPVRNMTGEASAHAQQKFGAVKADFVAYNKLTTGLRYDHG